MLEKLKSKPNDAALAAQIGNLYYDAQSYPLAIEYYQKALATDPKNVAVRTDMASALFSNVRMRQTKRMSEDVRCLGRS